MSRKTPNRFGSGIRGYQPNKATPSRNATRKNEVEIDFNSETLDEIIAVGLQAYGALDRGLFPEIEEAMQGHYREQIIAFSRTQFSSMVNPRLGIAPIPGDLRISGVREVLRGQESTSLGGAITGTVSVYDASWNSLRAMFEGNEIILPNRQDRDRDLDLALAYYGPARPPLRSSGTTKKEPGPHPHPQTGQEVKLARMKRSMLGVEILHRVRGKAGDVVSKTELNVPNTPFKLRRKT